MEIIGKEMDKRRTRNEEGGGTTEIKKKRNKVKVKVMSLKGRKEEEGKRKKRRGKGERPREVGISKNEGDEDDDGWMTEDEEEEEEEKRVMILEMVKECVERAEMWAKERKRKEMEEKVRKEKEKNKEKNIKGVKKIERTINLDDMVPYFLVATDNAGPKIRKSLGKLSSYDVSVKLDQEGEEWARFYGTNTMFNTFALRTVAAMAKEKGMAELFVPGSICFESAGEDPVINVYKDLGVCFAGPYTTDDIGNLGYTPKYFMDSKSCKFPQIKCCALTSEHFGHVERYKTGDVTTLNRRIHELERSTRDMKNEIQETAKEHKLVVVQLSKKNRNLESQIEKLGHALEKKREDYDGVKKKYVDLAKSHGKLEKKMDTTTSALKSELACQVADAEANEEALREDVAIAKEAMERYRKLASEHRLELEEIKAKNQSSEYQKELDRMNAKFSAKFQDAAQKLIQMEQKTVALSEAERARGKMETELEWIKEELRSMQRIKSKLGDGGVARGFFAEIDPYYAKSLSYYRDLVEAIKISDREIDKIRDGLPVNNSNSSALPPRPQKPKISATEDVLKVIAAFVGIGSEPVAPPAQMAKPPGFDAKPAVLSFSESSYNHPSLLAGSNRDFKISNHNVAPPPQPSIAPATRPQNPFSPLTREVQTVFPNMGEDEIIYYVTEIRKQNGNNLIGLTMDYLISRIRALVMLETQAQEEDVNECGICMEDLNQGLTTRLDPCAHIFHTECIKVGKVKFGTCNWLLMWICILQSFLGMVRRQKGLSNVQTLHHSSRRVSYSWTVIDEIIC